MSTQHPRYCNLTVSLVLNSAVTPVDRQSEEEMVEHILETELSSLCDHFKMKNVMLIKETVVVVCRMVHLNMYLNIFKRNFL